VRVGISVFPLLVESDGPGSGTRTSMQRGRRQLKPGRETPEDPARAARGDPHILDHSQNRVVEFAYP